MSVKNMKHMITLSLNMALILTVISAVTLNLSCRLTAGGRLREPGDHPRRRGPAKVPLEDGEGSSASACSMRDRSQKRSSSMT